MTDPQEAFLTHLQQHIHHLPRQDPLHSFRNQSWGRICDLGFPTKSREAFRYVPLKELYRSSFGFGHPQFIDKSCFEHAILPECTHSHLVFVDGYFSLQLSDISALPSQTVVLPLDQAFRSHAGFLQHHFSRTLKEENDPFALVNLALHSEGIFFYLPPKIEVKSPVQVLYLFTTAQPIVATPRLYMTIGSQSRLNGIVTSCHLQSIAHLVLPVIEVSLDEGSCFDLMSASDCVHDYWYLESVRVNVKKNARFQSLNVTLGAKTFRQSYRIRLQGENSEAHVNGLWMLKENRSAHLHTLIEHEAPSTHSMQRFKGVLNDASQSSFEGKIFVSSEAQKTEAYQLNNNLILCQGAVANSKPSLEIFADDVKASHGATVSQLDQEQLFYLSTRGIDPNQAKHLLIKGFCREMIARISYDSLLQKMIGALWTIQMN